MTNKKQEKSEELGEEISSMPNAHEDSLDTVTENNMSDVHENIDGDTDAIQEQEIDKEEDSENAIDLKDQLLRALAETENVRRRAKKEVGDASRYAIANFARDMLSVSDNMSRAIESLKEEGNSVSETVKPLLEGIEMTAREMATALERHGIKEINPMGEKFDYNFHQAMFETSNTKKADGTIIEVVQAGYVIGDRLLRPAMVGVAKAVVEDKTDKKDLNKEEIIEKVETSDEKNS